MNLLPDSSVVFSAAQIQSRIAELGQEITQAYQGKELHLVGVLKGAFVFMADLCRAIDLPLYAHFVKAASYHGRTQGEQVELELGVDLAGKEVLVIEDILDSGKTLQALCKAIQAQNPARVKVCVLLDKKICSLPGVQSDFTGFMAPKDWLVGYGLDLDGLYRNLPHVALCPPLSSQDH